MPRHLKRGVDASAIQAADAKVREMVEQILADVDAHKDAAVRELSQKFDNWSPTSLWGPPPCPKRASPRRGYRGALPAIAKSWRPDAHDGECRPAQQELRDAVDQHARSPSRPSSPRAPSTRGHGPACWLGAGVPSGVPDAWSPSRAVNRA